MITEMDVSILLFVQEHLRTEVFNEIWKFITHLGDDGLIWIALGVVLLFFKKTRPAGFAVLAALLIHELVNNTILKNLVARPRPFLVCEELVPLISKPSSYSFPSGHTSSSFAAAMALYLGTSKKAGIPALVLAALIGLSRIYVGVHYPTDVLAGAALGIAAGFAATCLVRHVQKLLQEKHRKKAEENAPL
ncbi:MAG: phosphatase PAP2 family protein [Lachnospiraceae bacterium]|nr:phosphatase PAP2 family protein [Lachnospiraceae bacterium]